MAHTHAGGEGSFSSLSPGVSIREREHRSISGHMHSRAIYTTTTTRTRRERKVDSADDDDDDNDVEDCQELREHRVNEDVGAGGGEERDGRGKV